MRKRMVVFIFLFLFLPQELHASGDAILRVHFIDVGQGDSILIETPENKTILIDGGEPSEGARLVDYLKKVQIEEIDIMIATHPDFDHIGGLLEVMRQFPVHQVIDNGKVHPTKTYGTYRLLLFAKDIPVKIANTDEKMTVEEDITLHFLNAANKGANQNDSSIALKLTYDSVDFLLMGDVESKSEESIASRFDIKADVLKVAHHGSDSSSTMKFLKKVNPEAAIIMYQVGNDYGHPVKRVINHLQKLDSQIFSTAGYGDIVIETDGVDYIIMPALQPMERLIQQVEK